MLGIPTTIKNEKLVLKRRQQIILAAIKLFARKGFHESTMRELSKAAGISHGNIYDYFGNKEDIFFMIHEFIGKENDERLNKVIETEDEPLNKLQKMIRSEFEILNQWTDGILLLYQETHILKKAYLKKLLQREREHVSRYEIVLQDGIKRKIFRDVNIRVMANLIKVMVDSWVFKRWDLHTHTNQDEMIEAIIGLIAKGLVREGDKKQ
jgi:3-oxoacyl-[acyl-carrier protein] reductase